MKLHAGPLHLVTRGRVSVGVGVLAVTLFLLAAAAGLALVGWVVMLLLGAVHHSVWEVVPALSFWQSVLVVMVLNVLSSFFKR